MSTEITTPNANSVAALASLRQGLAQVRASIPASVGGQALLRLLKDGQWVMGSEDSPVVAGTEAMINPMSFQSGYSCWTNRQPGQGKNELMGEEMWGVGAVKPPVSALPVHHDPRTQELCSWKDAMAVDVKLLEGPFEGTQAHYKVTSVGGNRVLAALLDAIMARLNAGSEYVCPIVQISADSYNHNSYGRTYVPKFDIVGWASMDGTEEDAPAAPAAKVAAPAPAPAPEPEVAAEPAGRRRRV
jgi:hypothetical protein